MKSNYPVARDGGISQQPYEAKSHIQRNGVKQLLRASGLALEGIRTVVDLGCSAVCDGVKTVSIGPCAVSNGL